MAIGGALRAAMKAGNWASAARESRRRAAALAELNIGGGLKSTGRSRNIQLNDVYEVDDIPGLMGGGIGARSSTPGGRTLFRGMENTENRMTYNPQMLNRGYNPIQAPYEGVRVWPGMGTDGFPRTFDAPPPWMGRGPQPPVSRTTMYDSFYGDEFPSAVPRSPYDEPFPMFEPSFPTNNRFTEPNVRLGDPYLPYSSFFHGTGY